MFLTAISLQGERPLAGEKGRRRDGEGTLKPRQPAHPAAERVCSRGCCQSLPSPAPTPHLPVSPAFPCLSQHPAWLIFPPALPVHAVDGLQVGQGFADLQHVEDERGHGETVLVLLQVLPQLQQDE